MSAGAWPEMLRRGHGGSEGEIKSCSSPELQISREEEDESLKHGDHLGEGNTNVFFLGVLGLPFPVRGVQAVQAVGVLLIL